MTDPDLPVLAERYKVSETQEVPNFFHITDVKHRGLHVIVAYARTRHRAEWIARQLNRLEYLEPAEF